MWPFSRKKTAVPGTSSVVPSPSAGVARPVPSSNTLPAVVSSTGTSSLAKPIDVRTENIKSIISSGEEIAGNLRLQHGIKIAGTVSGDIHFGINDGMLVLVHNGMVRGNILGPKAIIAGEVWGNIVINGRLIILPTARIHGDIAATSLQTHEGASIDGRICTVQDLIEQQKPSSGGGKGASPTSMDHDNGSRATPPLMAQHSSQYTDNSAIPANDTRDEEAPVLQFCVGGARR